jgi:hypothetical protein
MRRTHRYSRIAQAVTGGAAFLIFVSSLQTAVVAEQSLESTAYLASAVGVFAGALPNPDNTKAAALAEKESALAAREAALIAAGTPIRDAGYDLFSLVAFALSSLVLVLVLLNFYFDHVHTREERRGPLMHS